jgi:hypothetical protein
MVDVGSIMQKLDKSEKAREEIEQKLMVQDSKMGKRQVSSTDLLRPLRAPSTYYPWHHSVPRSKGATTYLF